MKKKSNFRTEIYRVFPTDMMQQAVIEQIDAKIRSLKTGDAAKDLALDGTNKWTVTETFPPGRVVILMHSGAEVALFYKRQVTSIQSDSDADPVPQCAIKDPLEAWTRLEFLHVKSSMNRTTWFLEKEKEYSMKIKALEGLVENKGYENDALQKYISILNTQVFQQEAEIKTLGLQLQNYKLATGVSKPKPASKPVTKAKTPPKKAKK